MTVHSVLRRTAVALGVLAATATVATAIDRDRCSYVLNSDCKTCQRSITDTTPCGANAVPDCPVKTVVCTTCMKTGAKPDAKGMCPSRASDMAPCSQINNGRCKTCKYDEDDEDLCTDECPVDTAVCASGSVPGAVTVMAVVTSFVVAALSATL